VLAPGADDDGSGTVAVMEAARVLGGHRFNATLVFAAFTAEELGLVGSDYCATCFAGHRARIGLNLNLDMIGYDPMGQKGIDVITDIPSMGFATLLTSLVTDYGVDLLPTVTISLAANSDHASFWAQGYPAIMLIETDFNAFYHSSSDLVSNVNMNLVTTTTQAAVATLATLAGVLAPGPGSLFLDRASYGVTGSPVVTLYDADRNANPLVAETARATLAGPSEPFGESVTLTETGPDTAVFTGTLRLGTGPGIPGELQVAAGDTITARYDDANPPAVVTDTATIDGAVPRISNVAAVPGIAGADVLWETDKPTDATVAYGTTPALGGTASEAGPSTRHRVALTDLQPDTAYYFDVRSQDAAGQIVTADRGGAHYAFHTLTGVVARPPSDRAGFVRSSDATGNLFGDASMLSGYSAFTGRTYVGAAQFDTSATPLPPAASVRDAWIDVFGDRWEYTGAGSWTIQYLNASIDAGWTAHNYAAITTAVVDFALPPTFAGADLVPGAWRTVRVPAAGWPSLRDRVDSGALSIRIDGPTGPPSSLFRFATGYPPDCPGLPSRMPRLSVLYSMTGDATGPDVTALAANPNPTMRAAAATIAATLSDLATGNTPIADAELFLGSDPGPGLATPMTAADGSFDSAVEDATFSLDVSPLPRGNYTVGVRARDRAWNWGPVRTMSLSVGVWDLYPPRVTATDAPDPAPTGGIVGISANVTDDVAVAGVWVNVTRPDRATEINATMAPYGSDWIYRAPYLELGSWAYTVWANDTSRKWGNASGTFTILARTPPLIASAVATPNPAEVPTTVNVTATVTDSDGLAVVAVNVTAPGGGTVNLTMSWIGASAWLARSYATLGTYAFRVWASDTWGTWAYADGTFLVQDTTRPTLSSEALPASVVAGGTVRIRVHASDNDRVSGVDVELRDPNGASFGPFPMVHDAARDEYVLEVNATLVGTYTWTVTARDPSGNQASTSGTFASTRPIEVPAWILWLILLPVVAAIAILAVVFLRRKRKNVEAQSRANPPPKVV